MTPLQKQLAFVALGLALLWWLMRRNASPATATTSAPAGNTAGAGAVAPGAGQAVAGQVPQPIDVAGSIADGGADFALQNGDGAGSAAWASALYDQLWLPASKIRSPT